MIQPAPPHTLVRASAGAGKSTAWLDTIPDLDLESTRTDYFVPDHGLAKERFTRIREAVPEHQRHLVRHHKGRAQPGMCEEPEYKKLANEAEALGISPFANVCPRCPLFKTCAWVAQHGDTGPGIIVKQHAHMTAAYRGVKAGSEKAPARFVVDESPLSTFLSLSGAVRVDELAVSSVLAKELGRKQTGLEADLRASRAPLVRALQRARAPLVSSELVRPWLAEITGALGTEIELRAYLTEKLNKLWSAVAQKPSHAVRARLEARLEGLRAAFTTSLRVSAILELADVGQRAPQRTHVFGLRVAGEGAERTVTALKRAELPEALRCAPGLWLDATGDERHYRALLGAGADLAVRRIEAKPVNYRLTQVVDRSFAKSRFVPREGEKEAGRKRRADANIDRLARFILYASCLYRGRSGGAKDVLVIAPKKVRKVIEGLLPDNVAALNFGKLRGIDEYRDVPCLIVVGREMPAMAQLELMTEALHWDNPQVTSVTHVAEGNWPRAPQTLNLADGRAVEIMGERHSDPNVAALQYEISGAEIEQALGRARLVQRTADNPCDVYLFGQTATRTPAHCIIDWTDADRDAAEIMTAAGVIFARGDTIEQAFPGLLPGARVRRAEAAAHAWRRGGQTPANVSLAPYKYSLSL